MSAIAIGIIVAVATIVGVAAVWHVAVKRMILASLGAAATLAIVATIFAAFFFGGLTVESGALVAASTFPAAFILSLGVGLPFYRRRNPPETFYQRNEQISPGLRRVLHTWGERPLNLADIAGIIIVGFIILTLRAWWQH